jgi:hypothetical protein
MSDGIGGSEASSVSIVMIACCKMKFASVFYLFFVSVVLLNINFFSPVDFQVCIRCTFMYTVNDHMLRPFDLCFKTF